MRQTRYIFLMALLVAALATQRVVASARSGGNGGGGRLGVLPDVTDVARQIVRRITRDETRPKRVGYLIRLRLSMRRLGVRVREMVSLEVPAAPRMFALWPMPPPVCA